MTYLESLVIEWRDARQAVFDHPAEISEAAKARWTRLGSAESALMAHARTIVAEPPGRERCLFGVHIVRPRTGCQRNKSGECPASYPGGCMCLKLPAYVDEINDGDSR